MSTRSHFVCSLVNVVALVWPIVIIRQALLLGDTATADDTRLQVRDHGIDLRRGERDTGRIQIVWWSPQRAPIAGTHLVGALIKRGHSGAARFSAADHDLEFRRIKPGGSKIGPGRSFIALLLAIRERAMTICTAGLFPDLQPGFHLVIVLRNAGGRVGEHGGSASHDGNPEPRTAEHFM